MLIKSVEIHNIRSYLQQKIDFPAGSILLSGDIGSGKSTMLLAIEFALFGIQRGEISGSDLLRHGKREAYVELELDINGKSVKIRRCLKKSNDSIVQDSGYMEIDGVRQDFSPSELKARVYRMFGYPLDMLNKKTLLFRYTVYTPQEQMKEVVSADSQSRLEIIRKIFDIDKYGRIRDNARTIITELNAVQRELRTLFRNIEEKKNELREKKADAESLEKKLFEERKERDEAMKAVAEKQQELGRLKEKIIVMNEKKRSLTRLETEFSSNKKRMETAEHGAKSLEQQLAMLEAELKSYAHARKMDYANIEKTMEELRREEKEKLKGHVLITEEITRLSGILNNGICRTCGQKVHEPMAFKQHIDMEKENVAKIESDISQIKSRLSALGAELTEARKNELLLEKKIHAEKRISEFTALLEKSNEEKAVLAGENKKISEGIIALESELKEYALIESYYSDIEQQCTKLQQKLIVQEKNVSRIEQMCEDNRKTTIILQSDIRKMEEAKDRAERVSAVNQWLSSFFIPLTEKIERHAMLAVQQEFNRFFQDWFNMLIEDENINASVNENFEPVINQNGYETDYTNLSGGEKTSVALAYRLALNKVINIMIEGIRTNDLLIMDEPTDGFSAEQLDKVRDVLQQLGLRQVIIVSHEQKMDSFVDSVVRIEKENHISRVM
ncbi:MAG: hypothetical protein HZB66_03460 [Candidatus Aenigmarchaeota archaeon]|nr:hypothetical protein [Candidatus Aenigmarchaeota archaeon]